MPRIIPNDSSRARNSPHSPEARARAGARQMRSSASCSSAKTDVAPMNSTTRPMTPGNSCPAGRRAASSRPCTASAPCEPSMPSIWL